MLRTTTIAASAWLGLIMGCGSSVSVGEGPPEPEQEMVVLDDFESACQSMCDRVDEVCDEDPRCFETCTNSRNSFPECADAARDYFQCLGDNLWTCAQTPQECWGTANAIELCISGCNVGAIGELEDGACVCGGSAVGGVATIIACEQIDDVLTCDCSLNGMNFTCEETVPENACSPFEGCCQPPF